VKVLVVHAHPVPESFIGAVHRTVVEALRRGGHDVVSLDLYERGFDPVLSREGRLGHLDPPSTKPDIAEDAAHLRWADMLVLTYPTWWGGPPAVLKGWLDRVWTSGIAFELPPGGNRIVGRLRNIRRLVVVTTHGSPRSLNVAQGQPGRLTFLRGMRTMCHPLCRPSWLAMYGLDTATSADRAAFLTRVDRWFSRR
jgi:putative NADPH-quinone reductase